MGPRGAVRQLVQTRPCNLLHAQVERVAESQALETLRKLNQASIPMILVIKGELFTDCCLLDRFRCI